MKRNPPTGYQHLRAAAVRARANLRALRAIIKRDGLPPGSTHMWDVLQARSANTIKALDSALDETMNSR